MQNGLKFGNRRKIKTCPCGRSNRDGKFVPFADFEDKGYCHSCGKTFPPDNTEENYPGKNEIQPERAKPLEYVDPKYLQASMRSHDQNSFVRYLRKLFDESIVSDLIKLHYIGTTRDGVGCIFWQVDTEGKIRTGKIIYYLDDGHRDKTKDPYFCHKKLNLSNIRQCLFGLHLVNNGKPIALVESEKTAVIMTGRMPSFNWMATGGISNTSKAYDIQGKKVVVFPDANAFELWKEKLSPLGFKISDALQKFVTPDEIANGIDIVDVIPHRIEKPSEPYPGAVKGGGQILTHRAGYPMDWTIQELTQALDLTAHNQKIVTIPWDDLYGKPKKMPMLTVAQYKKNGWKSDKITD